ASRPFCSPTAAMPFCSARRIGWGSPPKARSRTPAGWMIRRQGGCSSPTASAYLPLAPVRRRSLQPFLKRLSPVKAPVSSRQPSPDTSRSTHSMIVLEQASDFVGHVGKEIGVSEWITIDQEMIDTFARLTGDDQWIHVDVERARTELPEGRTIAHGYLVISMLPRLSRSIYRVTRRSRGINYGSNRVRFLSPVLSGSRIRARQKLLDATRISGATRITMESTIEIEGFGKPALVAETVAIIYDAAS